MPLTKAKVEQLAPGRDRKLFSMHSTRVAAVCYLLRAGLTETVVKAPADWTSDQIARYGRRLILDPELVEPWPFYNPESGAYVDAPAYAPAAKRRRAGAAPPANVPPDHTPDLNRGSADGREVWGRGVRAGLGRGRVDEAPRWPRVVGAGAGTSSGLLGYSTAVGDPWEGNII